MDRAPYNLRRVLRRCEPWGDADKYAVGSLVRATDRVDYYRAGDLFGFHVTGPKRDLWFALHPSDLLESVLRLAGGFVGDEVDAGQFGKRHNIEEHYGISLEEYERRIANGTKCCSVCRQWLPFIEFHTHRGRPLGLSAPCRDCSRAQVNRSRERRGLPPRKRQGDHRRPQNRKRGDNFEHAPLEESVVVDNFARGLSTLLKRHGATVQPEGMQWRITFADRVRYLATAVDCGIYRFEDGSAMLVGRHDRHLVASAINVEGEK